jgi:hypothetical protein
MEVSGQLYIQPPYPCKTGLRADLDMLAKRKIAACTRTENFTVHVHSLDGSGFDGNCLRHSLIRTKCK